ncbi:MAG TPA: Uma2 family endonuclease [Gemmataceae bacterium]|nr:Uma2 family endonuclease [Gemmataceae bacterium]
MSLATAGQIGPMDQGLPMTLEEFLQADFAEGYKYELIDGALYVSPLPDPDENHIERWLDWHLSSYSKRHPEVINFVSSKSRVFVPGRKKTTCPEPDLAAYEDYPLGVPLKDLRWQELLPVLTVEIMTGGRYKDLVRNVELYLQVPSIREYWVVDIRKNPDKPTLIRHRRQGKKWITHEFPYSSTFTTKLLPGFRLVIDPRK